VAIARDREDRISGFTISMSPATAPDFVAADPLLGLWVEHARGCSELGDAVLWRDSVDLTGDPRGRVQAMLGMAGILRSGAPNPRFAYMPIDPTMHAAVSFSRVMDASHLNELDREFDRRWMECHWIDYGPGGLIAPQRARVYRELGLADPQSQPPELPVLEADAVRDALRNFRVPHELTRSPLARGEAVWYPCQCGRHRRGDDLSPSSRPGVRDAGRRRPDPGGRGLHTPDIRGRRGGVPRR